jgi:hypothetical protein
MTTTAIASDDESVASMRRNLAEKFPCRLG